MKCSRCKQDKLSIASQTVPITLKGGFSGFFCTDCMNSWNAAYHASPVCGQYRAADIKYSMLEKAIIAGHIDIEDLLKTAKVVADELTVAMHGLYDLAVEWSASTDTQN